MQSRMRCAARRKRVDRINRGQRWTRDDLMRLQVMLNAGYGMADIGRLLSRSVDSIVARDDRSGLALPERRPDLPGRLPRP